MIQEPRVSHDADPAHPLMQKSLAHLPLPLFAAPMGVGGLGLAWREAARLHGAPGLVGEAILWVAVALWLAVFGLHVARWSRHPGSFAGDMRHPIRAAFAGAITIGLMIVAGALIPYAPSLAGGVWLVAVAIHVAIGVWTIRGLLDAPREAATLTPALLIPLVGNIVAPIFGAKLGYVGLSTLLFGVGAGLWVMVQPILLWRLIVGPPLMDRLKPMLAIFLAPPSVGALAFAALAGEASPGVAMIYGLAAFMALTLATLIGAHVRAPFSMAWWGWTFPAASFAAATALVSPGLTGAGASPLTFAMLLAATAIVGVVALRTARAAAAGALLRPE